MAELGFVGLGAMGGRMVERLLAAGHNVTGWNRSSDRGDWLRARGMGWAESPRAVAERAQITFTMVTDGKALQAVTREEDGILQGLGAGKVYVDMSTVSPAASRDLAEAVGSKQARMLDAPVSGSVVTLEAGQLSVMVGGDEETFRRVEPVLKDIGPRVIHVGANGQAALMKIATNLGLAVQMLAFSEAVLLAERGGIPRETAVEVLTGSAIASPMVKYRAPYVLGQLEEAMFDVDMMQKDLLLALDAGRQADVPLPTTSLTNELLTAARGMGLARRDFAILFEVLQRMAGDGNAD
jgi:3-hydroxyisobutyrate dehydrogenase-like beta-hydroxyacid dehydrogenase